MRAGSLGSAVAAPAIAIAAAAAAGPPPTVWFAGVAHQPQGAAQLSEQGGRLVVSNIGSSGKDGVSIDVGGGGGGGEAQGVEVVVDFAPPGQWPQGFHVAMDAVIPPGTPAGQDQKVACVQMTGDGTGDAEMSIDFSFLNPPTLVLDVFAQGQADQQFVFSQPFPDPLLVTGAGGPTHVRISNIGSSGKDGFVRDIVIILPEQTAGVSVDGNPPIPMDAMALSLDGLPPGKPVPGIARVDVGATYPGGVYQFFIDHVHLELFDVPHVALGQAHLLAGGDHLVISNIGSSGKDGVRQDPLPPSTDVTTTFNGFEPDLTGGSLDFGSALSLDGLPPGKPVIGTLAVPPGSTQKVLSVNFDALGSSTQTVELLLAGQVVFAQSGVSGPIAEAPTAPGAFATSGVQHRFVWDASTNVTIPGGPTITADEVRATAEPGAAPGLPQVTAILATEIIAAGDDEFTITGYAAAPPAPPCPWDCDGSGDGLVGVDDFLAVLAQWGQAGTSCDFTPGPVVGVDEFLGILAHWGACPP